MSGKAYLAAIAAILLWSTFALLALELAHIPPFLLVSISLALGSVFSLPRWREWRVPPATLILGIYGLFLYHFVFFIALRSAPPIEVNLLDYLWPLLIVLLSPVFLADHPLRPHHLIAAVLGFAGAALIVGQGGIHFKKEGWLGYVLAIAAAFIWASYSLLCKRVQSFSTAAIGLFALISSLLSFVGHLALENPYGFQKSDLLPLLLLGFGPMGIAFFCWDYAVKRGDPRIIGALSYLTPLLSTLFLIAGGKGSLSPTTGLAMLLIVGGALIGSGKWKSAKSRGSS